MHPSAYSLPSQLANKRHSNKGRRRSPISLTPLIDVVFILLVFFMLASSFLDWKAISLNTPGKAGAGASMTGSLLVEVRDGELRLTGQVISLDDLVTDIQQRLEDKEDLRVLIKPAKGVTLQQAIDVLDRLSAAGVQDLSLIRKPGA
ncbi:ExbD/TolR family protein [Rhodovibrionaceae bacterium A322]